ncbi:hypothetical protein TNCT_7041 [Trichonephila clavata]|uniref:Uncharacterized protein n=1 Tax=Trichonephila clavata TaxID=2740835 RepID=A0A8X6IGU7_TRICU|nr:hypothetical protein TNCT_7041 [Trichonephila clavata]
MQIGGELLVQNLLTLRLQNLEHIPLSQQKKRKSFWKYAFETISDLLWENHRPEWSPSAWVLSGDTNPEREF